MAVTACIANDGKRRWQVRVAVRDAEGRRANRTIGTYPTKREAQRAERDALTNRDRERWSTRPPRPSPNSWRRGS